MNDHQLLGTNNNLENGQTEKDLNLPVSRERYELSNSEAQEPFNSD